MSIVNTFSLENNRKIKIIFAGGVFSSNTVLILIKAFKTNDPVFKSVLKKDVLASKPTASRFIDRIDEDTLNQFLAISRVVRKKIYRVHMPQTVI